MNFSSSCVTPKDNSTTRAVSVDSYILTKPCEDLCPNRYMSATKVASNSVPEAPLQRDLEADSPIDAKLFEKQDIEVEYVAAEFSGDDYRRLIEPMAEFVPEETTCATSQVLR
jgi:hypothetical protein